MTEGVTPLMFSRAAVSSPDSAVTKAGMELAGRPALWAAAPTSRGRLAAICSLKAAEYTAVKIAIATAREDVVIAVAVARSLCGQASWTPVTTRMRGEPKPMPASAAIASWLKPSPGLIEANAPIPAVKIANPTKRGVRISRALALQTEYKTVVMIVATQNGRARQACRKGSVSNSATLLEIGWLVSFSVHIGKRGRILTLPEKR